MRPSNNRTERKAGLHSLRLQAGRRLSGLTNLGNWYMGGAVWPVNRPAVKESLR